ncbi:NUDIX hydrolase [Vibrio crassostreae]|uniref:NUDIX hydrolase n=1 Tax=Vibrio crassostreae TaxID=246167 RepID=UPI001B30091C|nr:NUDIX hydrolase [Vibrio crassostreae]
MRLLRNNKRQPKPYVKCHIVDPKKGFLLLRRALHDTHGGVWESVGGGVDKGEESLGAVIREVQEEAGLAVQPEFEAKVLFKDEQNGKPYSARLYMAEIEDAQVDISNNPDHDDFVWINDKNYLEFIQSGNVIDSWTLTHHFMRLSSQTEAQA